MRQPSHDHPRATPVPAPDKIPCPASQHEHCVWARLVGLKWGCALPWAQRHHPTAVCPLAVTRHAAAR